LEPATRALTKEPMVIRQLTAIMFTDMVGYTALMQEDEHRARLDRDRQRAILEAAITERDGRILQFYGDGTLSVFQSAVSAVESAIAIQKAVQLEPPIPMRIGIHSGDVVHDENGVFGDGVNVASRIEGLGVPGSVLISGKVFDEIKNQPGIHTRALGSFNLKNIKYAMRVYAVANQGLAIPPESAVGRARATRTKSIAVLPFVNMSPDPENEFFSDGITEEIINALTRVNGLQVTARTSSFAFKNSNEDIRGIAQKLEVSHVLEGSVRKAGSKVRVTAQLICAENGYHLMSEVYDGTLDDIFALQDEISRRIVQQLADHLGPVPRSDGARDEGLVHAHFHDTEAYAEYLKGRFAFAKWSPHGALEAIDHYERSIGMDPSCGLPYSGLAKSYVFLGATGHRPIEETFTKAEAAASKALELEDTAGEAHAAMGVVRLFWHWDWDGAYRSFQKALTLTPGSAEVHQLYGMYLRTLGDAEAAVEECRAALQLDPLSPAIRLAYADTLIVAGELDEARGELQKILDQDPSFRAAIESMGLARLVGGDAQRALELFERLPDLAGHRFAAAALRGYALGVLGKRSEAMRMLRLIEDRQQEHPHVTLSIDFAVVHYALGDIDRVFQYLNEAADRRLGGIVFLVANPLWRQEIRCDERFDALLERIGHPSVVRV
jgi:adenylate cyclase